MMKGRSTFTAPDTSVAVCAFRMCGIVKTFADNTPLYGQAVVVVEGERFVGTPAGGAVVDDDVSLPLDTADHIAFPAGDFVAEPKTEIANDDVVGLNRQSILAEANPVARCRLAGDGNGIVLNGEGGIEGNSARNAEHHRSRATGGNSRPEAPRTRIVQVGDFNDFAAATANGKSPPSLCTWKCKLLRGEPFVRKVGNSQHDNDSTEQFGHFIILVFVAPGQGEACAGAGRISFQPHAQR